MTWANDNRTLFFGELDDTHRPHKLYRHTLGETGAQQVFEDLRKRKILVRYFPGPRTGEYLRITVATDGEMRALVDALR